VSCCCRTAPGCVTCGCWCSNPSRQDAAGQGGGHVCTHHVLQHQRQQHHEQMARRQRETRARECGAACGCPACGGCMCCCARSTHHMRAAMHSPPCIIMPCAAVHNQHVRTHAHAMFMQVLFELARYHAPATIFIDEVDALMGARGAEVGMHGAACSITPTVSACACRGRAWGCDGAQPQLRPPSPGLPTACCCMWLGCHCAHTGRARGQQAHEDGAAGADGRAAARQQWRNGPAQWC
jgi:hypothetical protein